MTKEQLTERVKAVLQRGHRSKVERYFAVEPDGDVGYLGYQQRPAAQRNIRSDSGLGIWDNRDEVFIQLPDAVKRGAVLSATRTAKQEEVNALDERIERIAERGYVQ